MKQERLFQIINLLIKKKVMTATELAEILGVSIRTIYRDIDSLSLSGVPVYTLQGKTGGIAIMEDYKLEKTMFTEEERETIMLALDNFHLPDRNIDFLVKKLDALFQKEHNDWMEIDFTRWGKETKDRDKFNCIKQAILNQQELIVNYCSFTGEGVRTIYPLKLIYKSKEWYLWSFCLKAHDYRLFKVNRILYYQAGTAGFKKESFDKKLVFQDEQTSEEETISLRFDASVAYRIFDEFIPEIITKNDKGEYLVTVHVPKGEWQYGYLLTFGKKVEVLEPEYVRKKMKQMGVEIANIYEEV